MAELEVATAGEGATDEAAAAVDVAVDIVPARTMKKSELMHTQQQRRSMYVICFFFPPCVLLFPFFFFQTQHLRWGKVFERLVVRNACSVGPESWKLQC